MIIPPKKKLKRGSLTVKKKYKIKTEKTDEEGIKIYYYETNVKSVHFVDRRYIIIGLMIFFIFRRLVRRNVFFF